MRWAAGNPFGSCEEPEQDKYKSRLRNATERWGGRGLIDDIHRRGARCGSTGSAEACRGHSFCSTVFGRRCRLQWSELMSCVVRKGGGTSEQSGELFQKVNTHQRLSWRTREGLRVCFHLDVTLEPGWKPVTGRPMLGGSHAVQRSQLAQSGSRTPIRGKEGAKFLCCSLQTSREV